MREKLIELLKDADELPFDTYDGAVDFLIANGVTIVPDNNVGKWIPVTERLPDLELVDAEANDMDVYPCLCVIKHQRARGGRYVTKLFYDGENFMDRDMCLWTLETTHWMPLPEPPKEDAE